MSALFRGTLFLIVVFCAVDIPANSAGDYGRFLAHPPLVALAALAIFLAGALLLLADFSDPDTASLGWYDRIFPGVLMFNIAMTRIPPGSWTLDGDLLRWFGVAIFMAGGWLAVWLMMGDRGSSGKWQVLVSAGIRRFVRYPDVLALLVLAVGWDLALASARGMLITGLLLLPLLLFRIRGLEKRRRAQIGDEYAAYCSQTSRLIPGIF